MPVNYVVLAIPVFIVLIGLELLVARLLEKDYYSLDDSINDLSCGMLQQVLEVFMKTALFAGYVVVYERFRLMDVPNESRAAWAVCFLGVDLLYYWFHRMSHEVNAFWAAHVVHHQSEEYNLAVALRQGALQGWFSWAFYLPLAWVGFPPLMFLTLSSFNTLYQFWIHTRVIGRLGPLEWVLNTPSNHRVHHGRNPKYVDRNHGGTLIVWDRLFGTFQQEDEEPAYGITTPLRSWNPVWANVYYWLELWRKARQATRVGDKVRVFLRPPGWQPLELGGYQPAPPIDPSHRKYRVEPPAGLGLYLFVQLALGVLGTVLFLRAEEQVDAAMRAAAGVAIGATLVCLGGLLERKGWAFPLEIARLVGLVALAFLAAGGGWLVSATAVAAGLFAWLLRYRGFFAPGRGPEPQAG